VVHKAVREVHKEGKGGGVVNGPDKRMKGENEELWERRNSGKKNKVPQYLKGRAETSEKLEALLEEGERADKATRNRAN